MSRTDVVQAEKDIPSVRDIARRISVQEEPDAATMQIARAVHSRLVATSRKRAGRSCISCRHRISPGVTHEYVGLCVHPAMAETAYGADSDTTTTRAVSCYEERSALDRGDARIRLCGPQGLLHEPVALPRLLPYLRAYVRWMRIGKVTGY